MRERKRSLTTKSVVRKEEIEFGIANKKTKTKRERDEQYV